MKISLLCPTRERPEWMERFWQSAKDRAFDPSSIEVVFFIDDNDQVSIDKAHHLASMNELSVKIVIKPPKSVRLTDMYNECWRVATGEIYAPLNDDFIFESDNWDGYIREAFFKIPDRIALVYGHSIEGIKHRVEKVVMGFIHKNWTDTVGRISPPYFEYHYADVWVTKVAEKIERKVFLDDVVIIHYHCLSHGKESAEQRSAVTRSENKAIWNKHKFEIDEEAEKLRRFIDGYNT